MDEEVLTARAAKGDAEAFNQLLGTHEKRMYAVCLRVCGNAEDAQDCLQNAMLRVWRSISSFKGDSSFSTWLYRVAMNTSLDHLRQKKSRAATSLDTLVEDGWSPSDPAETPEKHAIHAEQKKALSGFIHELPDDIRAAVIMRDVHGFSYEEIAETLKINLGTVKSRISRGREKLRNKILSKSELFDTYIVK